MKTRPLLIALALLLGPTGFAQAQVSFDIGFPNVNIGFNLGSYPQLALIPGTPVYYAPRVNSNFFFYDGLYWLYQDDEWYSSGWYNGPWESVGPQYVPLYVLRVPVRYYRQPPQYFRGWRADAPPRWGQHWGREWEAERSGWNRWDRRSVPAAAPPPRYQRQYRGDEYPRAREQQHLIRAEHYRYQPRESVSRAYEEKARRPEHARPDQHREAPAYRQPQQQQSAPNQFQNQPQHTRPDQREAAPNQFRPENTHPNQQREAPEHRQPQSRPQPQPQPPNQPLSQPQSRPQPQSQPPNQPLSQPQSRPQPPNQPQSQPEQPRPAQRDAAPGQGREAPQQMHRPADRPDDRDKGNRGNEQRNEQRHEQKNDHKNDQNRDRH